MVIDDGVHEGLAGAGLVVLALRQAGRGPLVQIALLPSHEAMSAAVRDVAELGDVDVDQRSWVRVLEATQGFTGDPIDVREPVDPAAHKHRVHRRGRDTELTGDLDR